MIVSGVLGVLPLSAAKAGEREGPIAKRWEGEVGGKRCRIGREPNDPPLSSHLTRPPLRGSRRSEASPVAVSASFDRARGGHPLPAIAAERDERRVAATRIICCNR